MVSTNTLIREPLGTEFSVRSGITNRKGGSTVYFGGSFHAGSEMRYSGSDGRRSQIVQNLDKTIVSLFSEDEYNSSDRNLKSKKRTDVSNYEEKNKYKAQLLIKKIKLQGQERQVDPPFRFNISFNEAEGFYESIEEENCSSMYLADDTPRQFEAILREIILPGLWEEYALAGDEELSEGALMLKKMLLERISR